MTEKVVRLATTEHVTQAAPGLIRRPCDYSLLMAVDALETQLGSIEAYNRLAAAAHALKAKIDAGKAQAQHVLFRTDPGGAA